MSLIKQAALKTVLEILVRAGPTIAHVKPLRRTAVGAAEQWILNSLKQVSPASAYPRGVREDRAMMGLALLHSLERGIVERRLAPNVTRRLLQNLGRSILIEQGDWHAIQQFRAQHGVRPPSFLVISPGKACNLRCVGCYADAGAAAARLDWSTFDRIITEAKTLWGVRFFVISGGEPLVYRSQGKGILDAAAKHDDCFFLMYTNGTLIDEQVAARMAEVGNLTPALSVEGWGERTDARRGAGVFDQVLAAMARLRSAGVPFGISLTATRHNTYEILSDAFLDFFFEEQGALYGWLFHYMPIGRSFTLDLMPTPQQRLWMWHRSWEIVRERQIFMADFWNHGTVCEGCIAAGRSNGGGYLYIDWNGAVMPCVFVPYSPVHIQDIYARGGTLTDAWTDAFFAGIRAWQRRYKRGNGHPGNLLAPCLIRDHHDELRKLLAAHSPAPTDANAVEALHDAEYDSGLQIYGAAYEFLSNPIWEYHYLRPAEHGQARIAPLPKVPQEASTPVPLPRLHPRGSEG